MIHLKNIMNTIFVSVFSDSRVFFVKNTLKFHPKITNKLTVFLERHVYLWNGTRILPSLSIFSRSFERSRHFVENTWKDDRFLSIKNRIKIRRNIFIYSFFIQFINMAIAKYKVKIFSRYNLLTELKKYPNDLT